MSAAIPSSTLSQSAATNTTLHQSAKPDVLVAGESAQSVSVQSQLATSTVDGSGSTRSNLTQVVQDLGAAHTAHSGWAEGEMLKVTEWGNGEIARLMAQTKGVEQRLVADAQASQRLLEESHKVELAKAVQELDADKARKLKELEDSLQRQIQAALNSTKADINGIETEMNNRKMALLQQQQLRAAKDVDRLSSLAVEAKLVPSTTRTVIETNTRTGTIIAVAAGGEISTGQASSQSISSAHVQAVPAAGTLTQATDVRTGDIVTNGTQQKVGSGAIVNTMTEVRQGPAVTQPLNGAHVAAVSAPIIPPRPAHDNLHNPTNMPAGTVHAPATHAAHPIPTSQHVTATSTVAPLASAPLAATGHIAAGDASQPTHSILPVGTATAVLPVKSNDPHHVDTFDKHASTGSATNSPAHKHKESLLSKIKHAVTGHHGEHHGEPRSTDAHKRV